MSGRRLEEAGLGKRWSFRVGPGVCAAGLVAAAVGCSSNTLGGGGGGTGNEVPGVTVSGAAEARLGTTVQFTATVTHAANTAVIWQVNGVAGGNSASGTISASGAYAAPATIPEAGSVNITAVTEATPVASASVSEAIWNPVPMIASATGVASAPGLSTASYNVDVTGMGFLPTSAIAVAGGSAGATSFVSATELTATIAVPAGTSSALVSVSNPDPGGSASNQSAIAVVSLTAAARLLDQTTFGPTLSAIEHVQQVGLNGYLTEQFALPPTLLPDISVPPPTLCAKTVTPCEQSEWWQAVLTGPDQLRQRVAFALSEVFVISTDGQSARSATPYQNLLLKDAFTNFATIMKDVTLSPGMGLYLNMLNSNKPGSGEIANENYPRELMQLFTIGLELLNQDGSLQLDADGHPQPTYTEPQVQAFARAYTGWTYANASGGSASKFPSYTANYDAPMAPVESAHDMTAKTLLLGTTLPAGQTAETDLAAALDNIFNHPNVGPFVCRQLIQHLVASQPSPAYVGRVAAVFANNGQNVRGDMQAVIRAILTDPEARAGDISASFDGGHLREPMLYMTDVMRALGYVNTDANGYYNTLGNYTSPLGEAPYSSPSVFNFFPPAYVIPGSMLNAPEFGQENTASATLRLTLANSLVTNRISGFSVDLSATSALGKTASATGNATTDAGNLADELGTMFLHGQMPGTMRTAIVDAVSPLTDIGERVRVATYLVITSSEYKIEH